MLFTTYYKNKDFFLKLTADNNYLLSTIFVPQSEFPDSNIDNAILDKANEFLSAYFSMDFPGASKIQLPLAWHNFTDFQTRIYKSLLTVRQGSTISYKNLALMAGCKKGARAVGNAMANNPYHIIIPCHRVLKSDGNIGNYAAGPEVKSKLLLHEGNRLH